MQIRSILWLALCAMSCVAFAQNTVKPDGSVAVNAGSIPYSVGASPEAKAFFPKMIAAGSKAPPITAPIEQSRRFYDRLNSDRAARMQKLYPVHIHQDTIAGVGVDIVEPAQGISADNQQRVLLNLHGGGFLWGAHSGALVEAIPVASLGRIKVIGVDYRQGPEYHFPAASDDVEAVYRELLKHYPASHIGIYGCSAGGILTGEVTARLIHDQLPVPGAIGMFCGGLTGFDGDSAYIAPILNGEGVPTHGLDVLGLPYFKGANPRDPLVIPGNAPQLLGKFPPTLLISGTRDMALSSELASERMLDQAGVETSLHVWEGMWHSFFSDPELPESKDAYRVMVNFFMHHLAR